MSEKIITIVIILSKVYKSNYNIPVCLSVIIQIHLQLKRFMQEWGKQHGIININAVIIKFHNKSWAAIGCQMTSRWSSVEQMTT